jgi:ribosome-associated heat shock protein Hsp15
VWLTQPLRAVLPAPERIAGIEPQDNAGAEGIHLLSHVLGAVAPTADTSLLPAPGEESARARLAAWADSPALDCYATDRDRLDLAGSSRLSQDLRWGLLVNRSPAKPSTKVRAGDRVEALIAGRERVVEVVQPIESRVGALVAATCYVDHSPPVVPEAGPVIMPARGEGRPTKRLRRELERLRRAADA